jgi:uncharacterized protein YeaO (DUF488 family)
MTHTRRVYEPSEPKDGTRIRVDRLWPRGVSKKARRLDSWYNNAAPSGELGRRLPHDPARHNEFSRRYFAELEASACARSSPAVPVGSGNVVILYSARDE